MAEIILVVFYTPSLTLLIVYRILSIFGLFRVQNDKMEEMGTFSEK